MEFVWRGMEMRRVVIVLVDSQEILAQKMTQTKFSVKQVFVPMVQHAMKGMAQKPIVPVLEASWGILVRKMIPTNCFVMRGTVKMEVHATKTSEILQHATVHLGIADQIVEQTCLSANLTLA
jgi:hypothetical protein